MPDIISGSQYSSGWKQVVRADEKTAIPGQNIEALLNKLSLELSSSISKLENRVNAIEQQIKELQVNNTYTTGSFQKIYDLADKLDGRINSAQQKADEVCTKSNQNNDCLLGMIDEDRLTIQTLSTYVHELISLYTPSKVQANSPNSEVNSLILSFKKFLQKKSPQFDRMHMID